MYISKLLDRRLLPDFESTILFCASCDDEGVDGGFRVPAVKATVRVRKIGDSSAASVELKSSCRIDKWVGFLFIGQAFVELSGKESKKHCSVCCGDSFYFTRAISSKIEYGYEIVAWMVVKTAS